MPELRGLRRAALTALLCGQASAALAGVLPLALLPAAAAGAVVAASLSRRPARQGLLRAVATCLCLALTCALLPQVTAGAGLRGVLGGLLVGVATVQPLTWTRLREVQTSLGASFGLLVLGASFAPDVLAGLPLVAGWLALVVAVALAVRERAVADADVVLTGPAAGPSLPAATALAAVLGLVAFLLVPLPEASGVASRLSRAASADAAGGRSAPGAYTGDVVDLRLRGELSDVPLLTVPHRSPRLWRSGAYSEWDGATWRRSQDRRPLGRPPYVLAAPDRPTRTDDVQVQWRAAGTVWAPGPVVRLDVAGRSTASVDEHGSVRTTPVPGYRVTSAVVDPTLAQLRGSDGPDEPDLRWTTVPATVPSRVLELGRRLTADAPTRIDAVRAVERWLAANARYDLDSPVPAAGEDAVDRFLFVDRVGFCEQFAAAEVLLLRAAGIPARFVTGLASGVESGDDRRTYRQRDLHAWVEVFHPGTGWVASDPTPPSVQLAGAPLRARVAARLAAALRRADDVPGGRTGLAAGLLALTALAAAAAARRRPPAPVTPHVEGRPALQAFLRFDARLGAGRRRPAESLHELRSRLDVPQQVRHALELVEQECYAAVPPPQAAQAAEVLDRALPDGASPARGARPRG